MSEWVKHHGLWTRSRFPADQRIVEQVYVQDEYRTDLLPQRQGPELVLDIGAHIGSFARRWHRRNPQATILCVEANPENARVLLVNTKECAICHEAACFYDIKPVFLLNTLLAPSPWNTGGSVVLPVSERYDHKDKYIRDNSYGVDLRLLRKVTLEELAQGCVIDLLKLDVEGSEYNILEHTTVLPKTRYIIGEFHDRERWERLRAEKFAGWEYRVLGGEQGAIFHLLNPNVIEG